MEIFPKLTSEKILCPDATLSSVPSKAGPAVVSWPEGNGARSPGSEADRIWAATFWLDRTVGVWTAVDWGPDTGFEVFELPSSTDPRNWIISLPVLKDCSSKWLKLDLEPLGKKSQELEPLKNPAPKPWKYQISMVDHSVYTFLIFHTWWTNKHFYTFP